MKSHRHRRIAAAVPLALACALACAVPGTIATVAQSIEPLSRPVLAAPLPPASTANGDSQLGRISADGRFLVFVSTATDLVTNAVDGVHLNVFVRELATGATSLVSATPRGRGGNGDSYAPDIAADGSRIAFASRATDLVEPDTNGVADVFVADRSTGRTSLVSTGAQGVSANGECFAPRFGGGGRYVYFASRASNLDPAVPDLDPGIDLFVRDLDAGGTTTVSRRSRATTGSDVQEYEPSTDGRWIAFACSATNVVATSAGGVATGAFVQDREQGTTFRVELASASVPNLRTVLETVTLAFAPDRARLAIATWASGVTTGVSNFVQVLDLEPAGPRTTAVLAGAHALLADAPTRVSFAADGETLAFVQPDRAGQPAVLRLWRSATGVTTPVAVTGGSGIPVRELAIAPLGDRIAFTSRSSLVPDPASPTNLWRLYLLDPSTGALERVGSAGNGTSMHDAELAGPTFTTDGQNLLFASRSDAIVEQDRNRATDIFRWDLGRASTTAISVPVGRPGGAPAAVAVAGSSFVLPEGISADGRRVLFGSTAGLLEPNDANGWANLYVRDRVERRTWRVTVPGEPDGPVRPGFGDAVLSGNGRYVAFVGDSVFESTDGARSLGRQVFVRDLARGRIRSVGRDESGVPALMRVISNLRLSADGRYVAFFTDGTTLAPGSGPRGQVIVRDLVLERNWLVERSQVAPTTVLPADTVRLAGLGGRVIGTVGLANGVQGTWLDPASGLRETLSGPAGSTVALSYDGGRVLWLDSDPDRLRAPVLRWRGFGESEWQSFTPPLEAGFVHTLEGLSHDGAGVVLVESGNPPDSPLRSAAIVHLERRSVDRLEVRRDGAPSGSPDSRSVALSADARRVAFRSAASDLVALDPSPATDIFVRDLTERVTTRVARDPDEATDVLGVSGPILGAEGRVLAFGSWSSAFAAPDDNPAGDVFAVSLPALDSGDSDADGLADLWEWTWFGNLLRDGTGDYDGDGASDRVERLAGTCPIDDASVLSLRWVGHSEAEPALEWPSQPDRVYRLSMAGAIGSDWSVVGGPWVGDGSLLRATVPRPAPGPAFYRVEVTPEVDAQAVESGGRR